MSISQENASTDSYRFYLVCDKLFDSVPLIEFGECIDFADLRVSPEEIAWLEKTCPFLKKDYITYLSSFRFKPEQVRAEFKPKAGDPNLGKIEITATGPWVEAILWEVPLMSCLSELYFLTVDRDWNYDGQEGESMPLHS